MLDRLIMGGYAAYVWSAYGVVAIVFLLNTWLVKKKNNYCKKAIQHWLKSKQS